MPGNAVVSGPKALQQIVAQLGLDAATYISRCPELAAGGWLRLRRLAHGDDSTTPPKVGSFPSRTRGAERLPHFVGEAE